MSRTVFALLSALISITAHAVPDHFFRVDAALYRGAQPATTEDLDYLKGIGIRTIVNLRKYLAWEEPPYHAAVVREGMGYIHEPLPTIDLPDAIEIQRILKEISDPANQPVYVHCQLGRDRTGLVIALYRIQQQGWTPAAAYREWVDLGYRVRNFGLLPFFYLVTGFIPNKGDWHF